MRLFLKRFKRWIIFLGRKREVGMIIAFIPSMKDFLKLVVFVFCVSLFGFGCADRIGADNVQPPETTQKIDPQLQAPSTEDLLAAFNDYLAQLVCTAFDKEARLEQASRLVTLGIEPKDFDVLRKYLGFVSIPNPTHYPMNETYIYDCNESIDQARKMFEAKVDVSHFKTAHQRLRNIVEKESRWLIYMKSVESQRQAVEDAMLLHQSFWGEENEISEEKQELFEKTFHYMNHAADHGGKKLFTTRDAFMVSAMAVTFEAFAFENLRDAVCITYNEPNEKLNMYRNLGQSYMIKAFGVMELALDFEKLHLSEQPTRTLGDKERSELWDFRKPHTDRLYRQEDHWEFLK